jgi:hypothetical protein
VIKSILVLVMLLHHGAPADLAVATVGAAAVHDVEVQHLGGFLIVGHPGARYSGRCGDYVNGRGTTCGPYRLAELWPMTFGYELADRDRPWPASAMAARLLRYSQQKHERCDTQHDWRAHMRSRDRDSVRAAWKVRRSHMAELAVCPQPWCSIATYLP